MMVNKEDNINDIVQLEADTWPEGTRASKKAFENRIKTFPNGVIGARNEDNKLIGLATSCVLYKKDVTPESTWESLTDYGNITTHKEDGKVLYIVSLGVNPEYQRKGTGKQLLSAQKKLAKDMGLELVVLGSRVPDFHKYDMDITEYLERPDENNQSIDSLIRFYENQGFKVKHVISNYMEDDKESRNYGVVMEYKTGEQK